MVTPLVTMRRLLPPADAVRFLASFESLLTDRAAVLDMHGNLVARQGSSAVEEWAAQVGDALQNRPADDSDGQPVCMEGAAAYPLIVGQQNLGWLVVEEASAVGTAMQTTLALLLTERLEKRRLARETLDRYREVNLLYHLAERFGASLDVGELLQIALTEARRVIRADSGIVWLTGAGIQPGRHVAYFGASEETLALETFLRELLRETPDVLTPNIITDPAGADGVLATVLYAPLRVHGKLLGLLTLAKTAGQREFNAGEEKLLLALAGQAAGAIEKAMLHQQDLQHQRIAHELAVSRRIQRSLLPQSMPTLPGWEFAASYQAASQVGGDFYDIFSLPDETGCRDVQQYGLTIADVSGKGIPAALMMAFAQGILHNAAFAQNEPADVLFHTNQSIWQSSHSGLLLTAFYAVLNPCTGALAYANGGHEPPILYRAVSADCQELACGSSLLLGARREYPFREFETHMEPGDLLLLYTDGITEARDARGEFFAEDRLNTVLKQYARHGCAALITALNESLAQFTAGAAQSDDVTLLALRRLA